MSGKLDHNSNSASSSLPRSKRVAGVASRMVSVPFEPYAEMVAAGVEVLWTSGAVEGQLGSDELLVADIFQAMVKAASQ
jgi:hypothetical protein